MPIRPDIAQLAAMAQAAQGIPQAGAIPAPAAGPGGGGDIQDLLLQLRSGQISAGQLLQLVAAMLGAQGGGGGMPMGQAPQGPSSPIEMALAGQ